MINYEKIIEQARKSLTKNKSYNFCKDKSDPYLIRAKSKSKVPFSIKPVTCSVPRDLNLKDIFIHLYNSSFLLYSEKKIYIKLTKDEIEKRKYIIESIKVFLINHRIKYRILFNIIYMLDILICYNNKNNVISNMEQLGVGSAMLMIKFIYEEYMMISLNKFRNIFDTNKYTLDQLQNIEITCLKLIDYYLNFPTPLSFMELLLLNGIVFNTDEVKYETSHKIYNMILVTLEKIMISSNEYVKYNPLYLCCCVVAYCRNFHGIEKWPKILSKVFNVNQKYFEDIYEEFFSSYNHHYIRSPIINGLLMNNKLHEIENEKEINSNNKENINININRDISKNDINVNYINKDIHTIQKSKEINENNDTNSNVIKINNKGLNIKVNFKTTQEIRNSTLFRKLNDKYYKRCIRNSNMSENIDPNKGFNGNDTTSTKSTTKIFIDDDKYNSKFNYELIQSKNQKSVIVSKKKIPNLYKTPLKFNIDKSITSFYKPTKKNIEYNNNAHHRNVSTIPTKNVINEYEHNKQLLYSRDRIQKKIDETYITNLTNLTNVTSITNITNNNIDLNNNNNNQSLIKNDNITFFKNFSKNHDNTQMEELNNIDEIKVKVKQIYLCNNNNEEIRHRRSCLNHIISSETEFNQNIKNCFKNSIYRNKEQNNNSNNSNIGNKTYKKTYFRKNIHNAIKICDNKNISNNNILSNIPMKKEYNFYNEIKTSNENAKSNKIISNRHSSCSDKYKAKINVSHKTKDEDYSNETTSENSNNFSIRRNYFKLKRLRDRSTYINNDNTTSITLTNNNNLVIETKPNNKSIYIIKCNLKERERERNNDNLTDINNKSSNGLKSSKFKECLKIGFGSIDRRIFEKNGDKEKEKDKDKENSKSINHFKRYSDIRSFYKMKNINKNKYIEN